MPTQLHLSTDPAAVAADFTRFFFESLAGKEHFTVALSGGSTPKLLFQLWASEYRNAVNWSKVRFFWGDERCVPPN
ncbi:MAG: 6-phosphogluconolactonase, partial [Bacteroidota bacterium]